MTRILILISLSLLCGHLFAAEVVVIAAKGEVEAGPAGRLSSAKIGTRIPDGQSVKTGAGALAVLGFADGSRVKLKEKTEIVVHAIAGKQPQGLELLIGAVFSKVAKKDGQKFEVRTPTAVAGVRGTEFFTAYDKDTWMCVEEGQVEISEEKTAAAVLVGAGFGVRVETGKRIEAPQKFAWTRKLNWKMDESEGDLEDKTSVDTDYKIKLLKKDYD